MRIGTLARSIQTRSIQTWLGPWSLGSWCLGALALPLAAIGAEAHALASPNALPAPPAGLELAVPRGLVLLALGTAALAARRR